MPQDYRFYTVYIYFIISVIGFIVMTILLVKEKMKYIVKNNPTMFFPSLEGGYTRDTKHQYRKALPVPDGNSFKKPFDINESASYKTDGKDIVYTDETGSYYITIYTEAGVLNDFWTTTQSTPKEIAAFVAASLLGNIYSLVDPGLKDAVERYFIAEGLTEEWLNSINMFVYTQNGIVTVTRVTIKDVSGKKVSEKVYRPELRSPFPTKWAKSQNLEFNPNPQN